MLQDLAALTPPAIVCAAVLIGTWAIVRRELAPKRRQRAEPSASSGAQPADEDRAVDPERAERGRSHIPDIGDLSGRADRLCGNARHMCLCCVAVEVRVVRLRPSEGAAQMTTYAWAIC
jgi:predicted lipid-binding transport protein (Tim44 family)